MSDNSGPDSGEHRCVSPEFVPASIRNGHPPAHLRMTRMRKVDPVRHELSKTMTNLGVRWASLPTPSSLYLSSLRGSCSVNGPSFFARPLSMSNLAPNWSASRQTWPMSPTRRGPAPGAIWGSALLGDLGTSIRDSQGSGRKPGESLGHLLRRWRSALGVGRTPAPQARTFAKQPTFSPPPSTC